MDYEGVRRVCYKGGAVFVPVCQNCNRFVKADDTVYFKGSDGEYGLADGPNATCKKCGRTEMLFEGFFDTGEEDE